MSQEDDYRRQMNKPLKILRVVFITDHQPSEAEEPGEEPLNFPAFAITAQRTAILRWNPAVDFVGGDEFRAVMFHQGLIQPVAVVSLVANQTFGHLRHEPRIQRGLDQFYFRRRSACCPQGERKTVAVRNAHDFGAFAALGLADQPPPFLAGTNVPSTKHSFKSSRPACRRCSASPSKTVSMTPERTHCWKRRCAVWHEPYRGGKSFHGAPVRKTQSTPLNTVRRSRQGRPRPSARTLSGGRTAATMSHCSLVNSIHNHLHINGKNHKPYL